MNVVAEKIVSERNFLAEPAEADDQVKGVFVQ